MPIWVPWTEAGVEPRIPDVLSDPIVHRLMRADGVAIADLLAIIFDGDERRIAESEPYYTDASSFDWTHGIAGRS